LRLIILFICEPFGSGLCAVRVDDCLLALFRSAVVVELVVAGFLEGERAVYGAWEDSRP